MRILVVGAGQMGSGIAQVCAAGGNDVLVNDVDEAAFARGRAAIAKNLARAVEKGKQSQAQADEVLARIGFHKNLSAPADVAIAIEAASEDETLKKTIFKTLDGATPPNAVLASNTSSISITRLGAATKRPERVIGMHFMNPVPVMKLVEIIRGLATSDETFAFTKNLAQRLGKTPVEVNDFPGFVSNRVLMPMINEAIYAHMEGVGSAEAIDTVMKLGMNHPMGPLELADFIGLDTCLSIMQVLYDGFSDAKYRPCPLLKKMVDAGYLGRKSGRGFYTYP
jgi:3-hydroxybutyryl-CoA dehydrogenase